MYGCSLATEVLRDTHFRLDAPGENIKAEDRAEWSQQVTRLLHTLAAEDAEDVVEEKQKKLQRMSSFVWLLSVDWMLQVIGGPHMGLKAFHGPAEGVPIQERHHLSICLDKGTDGFASVWYMLYAMELRMTTFLTLSMIPGGSWTSP